MFLLFFFLGLQQNIFLCVAINVPHASYYAPLIILVSDLYLVFFFGSKVLKNANSQTSAESANSPYCLFMLHETTASGRPMHITHW